MALVFSCKFEFLRVTQSMKFVVIPWKDSSIVDYKKEKKDAQVDKITSKSKKKNWIIFQKYL